MSRGAAVHRRAGRAPGLDPDELAALEEQRDFLLRSLEDLDREHDAGDLDDDDYGQLRDDYTARAAEAIRAIDDHRAAVADVSRPARGRRLAVVGGVAAFALLAGWLVAASLGGREPGGTASGGIDVQRSPSQRAQACLQTFGEEGPGEAITCFQGVLEDDPRNPVALTYLGWTLELSSGGAPPEQLAELQDAAQRLVERAVEADPDYSPARAFRAIIAFRRGRYDDAKRFLEEFRANDPSPDAEAVIAQFDLDNQIEAALAGETPGTTSGAAPDRTTGATTTTTAPG